MYVYIYIYIEREREICTYDVVSKNPPPGNDARAAALLVELQHVPARADPIYPFRTFFVNESLNPKPSPPPFCPFSNRYNILHYTVM